MKMNGRKIAAIIFMILMVGTLAAYAVSQAGQLGLLGSQAQSATTLPTQGIINYELSADQQQLALTQGFTIIKYSYSVTCTSCLTTVNQLEGVASQFSGSVYLENLASQSAQNDSTLVFTGAQNSITYKNPTVDNIIDGMCSTFSNPPSDCLLRKLNVPSSSTTTTQLQGNPTVPSSNTTSTSTLTAAVNTTPSSGNQTASSTTVTTQNSNGSMP